MATTVQPTTRERTSVPAAATPWYRDRNRQLIVAAIAVAVVGLDAGDAFSNASKAADLPYLKAHYLVDAARAYREGGKTQQAIAAYREIIQKYPKTTSVTEAQVRLAELTDGKM